MKNLFSKIVLFILGVGALMIGAFFSVFIVGIALVLFIIFGIYWKYKIKKFQKNVAEHFESFENFNSNDSNEDWQPIQAEFTDPAEEPSKPLQNPR